MKKRERSYLALLITMAGLLSTAPVHANGQVMDISVMWPESAEEIGYVIDFVDWDGELLDSRICTYGERLRDIIVPGQREEGGRVYRFTGWEPKISEIVTGSMAYMAIYQSLDGSHDESAGAADIIAGPETEEMSGLLEKEALGSRSLGERTQVSSTSYDVTSFHIGSSDERPELSDGWAEELEDGDFFGLMIPEIEVFEVTGSEEAEQGIEAGVVCIPESMGAPPFMDIVKEDLPETIVTSDPMGISGEDIEGADDASKEETPVSQSDIEGREMSAAPVQAVQKTSAVKLEEQEIEGADLVSQKSFPLMQFLCSVAIGAVGTWIGKGVQIHVLSRKRR